MMVPNFYWFGINLSRSLIFPEYRSEILIGPEQR